MPKQVKPVETEKITLNVGYVDLGRIDLLVEEGFYTTRADFLRAAIRTQLGSHAAEMGRLIERRTLDIGLRDFSRADLEATYGDINAELPIVSYCNTGHWAATNWFVLSEVLGRDDVKLYDGSMVEWTADGSNPLAAGESNMDKVKNFLKGVLG